MNTLRPRVLLFVSRESAMFNYVRHRVETACSAAGGVMEVIEISERPDLAEKLNIEALPTVVIGERRFIGIPDSDLLRACLEGLVEENNKR